MVETKKDVSRPTVQNEQLCELSATEILPKKDDYTPMEKRAPCDEISTEFIRNSNRINHE